MPVPEQPALRQSLGGRVDPHSVGAAGSEKEGQFVFAPVAAVAAHMLALPYRMAEAVGALYERQGQERQTWVHLGA